MKNYTNVKKEMEFDGENLTNVFTGKFAQMLK